MRLILHENEYKKGELPKLTEILAWSFHHNYDAFLKSKQYSLDCPLTSIKTVNWWLDERNQASSYAL